MVNLKDKLRSLEQAAAELTTATEAINATLKAVETALVESKIGLEAEVELRTAETTWVDPEDRDENQLTAFKIVSLCFRREVGWGLYVRTRLEARDAQSPRGGIEYRVVSDDVRPLNSASRSERAAAAEALPQLLEELEGHARKVTTTFQDLKDRLEK